jgi:arsenical resistance protein ArsH
VVNTLRILGRWMRMVTIQNQSSVPKACEEFDENCRMKPLAYYDRVVDVMEKLMKFTLLHDQLLQRTEGTRRQEAAAGGLGCAVGCCRDLGSLGSWYKG